MAVPGLRFVPGLRPGNANLPIGGEWVDGSRIRHMGGQTVERLQCVAAL